MPNFSSFQLGSQQYRDPLTIAIGFMSNPDEFRGCCTYTNAAVQQALEQDGGGSWVKAQQFTFKIPLRCVTQPDVSWFRHCKQVVFRDLSELTEVGHDWLDGCTALESASFEQLPKLQSLGVSWLAGCTSLKQVVFKDLPELTTVGAFWLYGCTALESVSFESLPKLQSVGMGWLQRCTSLKQVVFNDLPELTEVGEYWLYRCTALESATFAQLPELQSVGPLWLAGCSRLEHLILQDIRPSLSIGGGYLQGCTALQVNVPMLSATDLEIPFQTIPRSAAPGSIAPTFTTTEDSVLLEHTNEKSTLTAADLAQQFGAPSSHDPPPSSSDPTTQSGESSSADPSSATTVCNDQQVGPRMRPLF